MTDLPVRKAQLVNVHTTVHRQTETSEGHRLNDKKRPILPPLRKKERTCKFKPFVLASGYFCEKWHRHMVTFKQAKLLLHIAV